VDDEFQGAGLTMCSFGQLAAMVSEQSEMIERIDANTYVGPAVLAWWHLTNLQQRRRRGQRRGGAEGAAQILVPSLGQPMAHSQDVWCSSTSTVESFALDRTDLATR
jgi:hypothetical protein